MSTICRGVPAHLSYCAARGKDGVCNSAYADDCRHAAYNLTEEQTVDSAMSEIVHKNQEEKMSLEKYDRFQWHEDVIMEYTGTVAYIGEHDSNPRAVFKIIMSSDKKCPVNDIIFVPKEDISDSSYKKLPRPATHPLLQEVARIAKDDPAFLDEFLDGFAQLWEIMTPEQKRDLIFSLNERLPQEIKDSFQAPGGCCGEHEERFSSHRAIIARKRNGLPLDEKEIRPKREPAL